MPTLEAKNKIYPLDDEGFLIDPLKWDEDFAEALAPSLGITRLTRAHWDILKYIRSVFLEKASIPIARKTCKVHNLNVKELERLFPSGYQRGACKLAGMTLMVNGVCTPAVRISSPIARIPLHDRIYRVNVQGCLIDHNEWDEDYAVFKARELQMPEPLNEKHWAVIRFLRSEFEKRGQIPTIYATCEHMKMDLEDLSELFPSGYHRGAVRIAGLNLAEKPHTVAVAI